VQRRAQPFIRNPKGGLQHPRPFHLYVHRWVARFARVSSAHIPCSRIPDTSTQISCLVRDGCLCRVHTYNSFFCEIPVACMTQSKTTSIIGALAAFFKTRFEPAASCP